MGESKNRHGPARAFLGWLFVASFVALSFPPQAFMAMVALCAALVLSLLVGLVGAYFALRTRKPRQ